MSEDLVGQSQAGENEQRPESFVSQENGQIGQKEENADVDSMPEGEFRKKYPENGKDERS